MCFAIALNNFPFKSSEGHVENAIRPSLAFVTRIISLFAISGFGGAKHISKDRQNEHQGLYLQMEGLLRLLEETSFT